MICGIIETFKYFINKKWGYYVLKHSIAPKYFRLSKSDSLRVIWTYFFIKISFFIFGKTTLSICSNSERGRKNGLPPPLEKRREVKKMKSTSHEEHKRHAFDSYCKKILKNEAINIQRQLKRQREVEISLDRLH